MNTTPLAKLWLQQAGCDLEAASYFPADDASMYCQILAKYQQTVEKSVKAAATALERMSRQSGDKFPDGYEYDHDVSAVTKAIQSMARGGEIRPPLKDLIRRLDNCSMEIRQISSLSPKRPKAGAFHRRNTEYPFEIARNKWRAPSDAGVFTEGEVDLFSTKASEVYKVCRQIVQVSER